jgi:mannitol-1-phosphate/altronate dehydrogenase
MSGAAAVHFGAGNIGRGFVGLLLHRAGYQVVFVDVVDELIDALNRTPSYRVKEVGHDGRPWERGGRSLRRWRRCRAGADKLADLVARPRRTGP